MNTPSSRESDPFPESGRLAGIDFGTVRVGVAICDPGQTIASPYENYQRRSIEADERYFRKVAVDERLVGWVVGLPIHLSGEESQKSNQARDFAIWLSKITELPIRMFDERFTTALANEILDQSGLTKKKRKQRLDQLAAQILLTAFLESNRQESTNESID